MKKSLLLLMGAALLMSCGNSSEKMKKLAKENLELSVDYPKQLRVLAVSEPDSAFGAGYFTKDEVKGMLRTMQVVTDTIMKRTDNMNRFNPADHYVVSLAERQMRSMAEIRSLIMKGDRKGEFSGWKVKIDYPVSMQPDCRTARSGGASSTRRAGRCTNPLNCRYHEPNTNQL
jgi:hypothetical protein